MKPIFLIQLYLATTLALPAHPILSDVYDPLLAPRSDISSSSIASPTLGQAHGIARALQKRGCIGSKCPDSPRRRPRPYSQLSQTELQPMTSHLRQQRQQHQQLSPQQESPSQGHLRQGSDATAHGTLSELSTPSARTPSGRGSSTGVSPSAGDSGQPSGRSESTFSGSPQRAPGYSFASSGPMAHGAGTSFSTSGPGAGVGHNGGGHNGGGNNGAGASGTEASPYPGRFRPYGSSFAQVAESPRIGVGHAGPGSAQGTPSSGIDSARGSAPTEESGVGVETHRRMRGVSSESINPRATGLMLEKRGCFGGSCFGSKKKGNAPPRAQLEHVSLPKSSSAQSISQSQQAFSSLQPPAGSPAGSPGSHSSGRSPRPYPALPVSTGASLERPSAGSHSSAGGGGQSSPQKSNPHQQDSFGMIRSPWDNSAQHDPPS